MPLSFDRDKQAPLRISNGIENKTMTALLHGFGSNSHTARGSSSERSLQSRASWILSFAFIVFGTACGSMGKPHFQTYGIEKAVFDMQCAKEKLDVVELSSISVGVRGCGRQGRYEMLRNGEWVLNSAEGASASSSPAGAKSPPSTRPPAAR